MVALVRVEDGARKLGEMREVTFMAECVTF